MKTWEDVQNRLRAELEQWFIKQCRDNFEDYYLYYLPTTEAHDGGFMFLTDKPANPDYRMGWNRPVNKGKTIDQNFSTFSNILKKLPIMSATV